MALTVKITSSVDSPAVGTEVTLTATPTGAATGATMSYAWTVGGSAVDGTTDSITYTPTEAGTKAVAVTATATGTDSTTETATDSLDVVAVNKTFSGVTVAVTADPTAAEIGDSVTYTAAVTGAPDGATLVYAWYNNDSDTAVSGQTSATYTNTYGSAGTAKVKASVTLSADNYDDATFTSDDVSVVISEKTMDATLALAVSPSSVKTGATYKVTATVTGAPTGATVAYSWTKNGDAFTGTDASVSDSSDTAGTVAWVCTAVVSADGYSDSTLTANTSVSVTEPDYDSGTVDSYHILPQRDSVFYQVGWWVMDVIQDSVANGVDWTDPDANNLKYAQQLRTVAKLVNEFDNVEIQESRNGRILDAATIKSGKIYTW